MTVLGLPSLAVTIGTLALYRGLGFAEHHAYQYRTAPEAKPSVGTEAS